MPSESREYVCLGVEAQLPDGAGVIALLATLGRDGGALRLSYPVSEFGGGLFLVGHRYRISVEDLDGTP